MLLFLVFIVAPFVAAIALSFFNWDLLTPAQPAGLANYAQLFGDRQLVHVLANTFVFALGSVVTHVAGGLLLALALNHVMNRILASVVKATLFFPLLISWAAVALLWKYVLDPTFGYIGYYLRQIGIPTPSFFADPHWALAAIIGVDFWHTIGYTLIIMLAGLQTVPRELVEAAQTDGASSRQVFFNVTLPLMSPTIFFATVITFIGAFQIFDPMQIITQGGPNESTMSVVQYLYLTAFQSFNVGYASTIALVVFVIVMGVTAVQFWASRRWVYQS
ncbi:ABC transporter permease [Pseudolysinimonas kribbensis]|uniref:ABC transporter permease n=2 Tax=Pseudolysinimonas kribbensis TaxID=433641 RepID=A0ABQ6K5E9_9MICO|nr:sugar ABC transporter permease [Pseudolysinimonas kribbensis]GMA94951.1 ABC transporter permease [Pseudolysinimonas kribbensis]